jgi:thiamine biosynthesis lipoprotein ApbE
VLADGLSTAMMVMGPQRSLQCAQDLPGVDVLCISKSGQRFASVGFPEPLS